ncbi:hypothetical protein [Corallococcus caeni]|uniref:MotA/TolQ/ExbB proton channel domain-containing protein n=1 Tax=Corallococcus caeni TaxID=3082388 RepID=A0ABQ6QQY8_9BACT|nr:hypothetical protein ASNO1_23440 [Corallococcus sp. NO1]
MQFSLANYDFDGSISNPYLAAAVIASALVFGLWMARLLLSKRTRIQKGVQLAGIYIASILGTELFLVVARLLMTRTVPPEAQVGYIGGIPTLLGPTLALAFGATIALGRWLLARMHSGRAS